MIAESSAIVGTHVESAPDRGPDSRAGIVVSLGVLAAGAMLATVGFAKLYGTQLAVPDAPVMNDARTLAVTIALAWQYALIGSGLVLCSALATLFFLGRLPHCNDCEKYGRHMVGLTYVLLVLGLCNGVGMSTLAQEGGLSISATTLMRASDPSRLKDADERLLKAKTLQLSKTREHRAQARALDRAQARYGRVCGAANVAAASDKTQAIDCDKEHELVVGFEESVIKLNDERADATQAARDAQTAQEICRKDCKAALFFLLSSSTMMALFGATFFVVNRVSRKRALVDPNLDGTIDEDTKNSDRTSASRVQLPGDATSLKPMPSERFDTHAFWSGAFFRAGEAVLFTFSFFWLFWTSSWSVIWLPVLALFVGMFVKTGETVVFQLGERLLLATEALLPALPKAGEALKSERPKQ